MSTISKTGKGFTVWARQTVESQIFFYKPDKWFKIWFFIVNRVNYQDGKLFKRGEGLITYEEIGLHTGATKAQVEKCIKWLHERSMLRSVKTTRGMRRIVLNYAKYQDQENYKKTEKKTSEKSERRVGEELEKVPIVEERKKERKKEDYDYYATSKKIIEILRIQDGPENNFQKLVQGQLEHYRNRDSIGLAYRLAAQTANLPDEQKYFKFSSWLGRELTEEQKNDLNPHSKWKKLHSERPTEPLPDPLTMPLD